MQPRNDFSALVRLSIPLVAVNLGNQLMGVVDTAIAGRIDELSLAATGLGNTIMGLGAVAGLGVVLGIDPIASQAFGAERPREARRAMWAGIYVGLITMLPVVAFTWALGAGLEFAGVDPVLAVKSRQYLNPRLLQFLPFFIFIACRAYLQAAHRTGPMVVSMVVANLFNGLAAWALAFGVPSLGLPAFGIVGLAWATNASSVVQLAIVVMGVRGLSPGEGTDPLRRPDRAMVRRAFRLGIPLGLQLLAEVGIFSLVGILVSRMGTARMGAHQVAITVASLTFMVPLGISMATSVQVGRAIGANDTLGARRAGFYGITLGGGFMLMAGLVLWLQPGAIARAMTDQPAVIAITVGLLQIAGAFQLFDGIQCCGCGALRGAGETRWAFVANVVGYWLLGLPLGLALMGRFGPYGLWWGLTLGLAIVAVTVSAKFHKLSSRPIAAMAATP